MIDPALVQFLYHWFVVDFWVFIWPNIAADPFCALLAVLYGVFRLKKHITKEHEKSRAQAHKHHLEAMALAVKHHNELKASL
jgi:hypothetical protein